MKSTLNDYEIVLIKLRSCFFRCTLSLYWRCVYLHSADAKQRKRRSDPKNWQTNKVKSQLRDLLKFIDHNIAHGRFLKKCGISRLYPDQQFTFTHDIEYGYNNHKSMSTMHRHVQTTRLYEKSSSYQACAQMRAGAFKCKCKCKRRIKCKCKCKCEASE